MTAAAAAPDGAQLPEGYTLPDYEEPIDAEAKLWKLLGDHLQVSKVPCGRLQGVLAACAPPSPFPGCLCRVFCIKQLEAVSATAVGTSCLLLPPAVVLFTIASTGLFVSYYDVMRCPDSSSKQARGNILAA